MRLIAGCPVANRAWSLDHWFKCLAGQTRRPDWLVFVHGGEPGDPTERALWDLGRAYDFGLAVVHDEQPPRPRHDNERFRTLTKSRNELLDHVQMLDADMFLSLDSDIMLEQPDIIERLEQLVVEDGHDLASPVTFLHPAAPTAWSPAEAACWAYNAGWWVPGGELDGCRRPWARPPVEDIPWGAKVTIDIPMAVWLGNRRALQCRYQWHDQGEDVGFAQELERAGLSSVWDTGMYAWHCWEPRLLDSPPYLPPSICWTQ